ncbi:hypothetical protein LTR17_013684 [Elasticomyces elasticus]|nr:hypothetical protein LTR17_013684 [Elasticomyces elasticus]
MKDAAPVRRRHVWNLCLALAFLALLVRAIEKPPLNDATRQDQRNPAWMSPSDVAICVMLVLTLWTCMLMYEADRKKPYEAPFESAWVPCLAQVMASLMACILLATEWTTTCGTMTLNADIGGVGVLVGIYFPVLLAILSLGIGHYHTREAGTKEIGVVLLANLIYLTFNLLKATTNPSGLSFADAVVALLSIDATSAALSATTSNKDALAARTFVGLCAFAQVTAAVAAIVTVATLGHSWAEQRSAECCSRQVWWTTWTSCGYPGPNLWLYILLGMVTRGYDLATAFILAPKLDRSKKEAETKKTNIQTDYESTVSTCLTRYVHDIPALLLNFTSLLALFYRMGLKNSSKWTDWGQSATLITCVFGTGHWIYVCVPLLKLVDVAAETTNQKSRWFACAQFWVVLSKAKSRLATRVIRAFCAIIPQQLSAPERLTPDQLGSKLVMGAEQGDLTLVREALIQGADIDWHQSPRAPRLASSMPHTALMSAIKNSHATVVKFLIQHGATTVAHSRVHCHDSALHLAAKSGRRDMVEAVLGRPAPTGPSKTWARSEWYVPGFDMRNWRDHESMTPYDHAIQRNHRGLFDTLVVKSVVPPGTRSLHGKGSGIPIRPPFEIVFFKAMEEGNPTSLLRLWLGDLLPRNSDPTKEQRPDIWLKLIDACEDPFTLEILLSIYRKNGWPTSFFRETNILSRAVLCHNMGIDSIRKLCLLANIDRKHKGGFYQGHSPLNLACTSYRPDRVAVVAVLLQHGASPNCSDNEGETPLNSMCGQMDPGCIKMARMLIRAGADVDAPNKFGETPLFKAVLARSRRPGSLSAIELLLGSGATPLTYKDHQRLANIKFKAEFANIKFKAESGPPDMSVDADHGKVVRRSSLSDVYPEAKASHPSLFASEGLDGSSTFGNARERNWLRRSWDIVNAVSRVGAK